MLSLYNTMSRNKDDFQSIESGRVKMFTCGPSVYQRPHLGNYRTFLYEDILQRYLEYLGYNVDRVMSLTDLEDKAFEEARKEKTSLEDLTKGITHQFIEEARLLRINLPSHLTFSSDITTQAVQLIKILLEKGYAYWHKNDVFYDPLKFQGFGKLYGLDMSLWPHRKRHFIRDTYPGRQWNLGDFILWHGYRKGEPVYRDTEIGRGRPAWNIQDAAMIASHLGFRIDIICGGIDNLYRHHDYTLAVMEAVSGQECAHYWLHGEHLFIKGKKMSKSSGNIIYLDHLIKDGYSPVHIRFFLIYGHYREKMNLTYKRLKEAHDRLEAFKGKIEELLAPSPFYFDQPPEKKEPDKKAEIFISQLIPSFENQINNDLFIKGAFDYLFETISDLVPLKREGRLTQQDCAGIKQELEKIDRVLQILFVN